MRPEIVPVKIDAHDFFVFYRAMNIAEHVIGKFGGTRALARAIGKPATTIQSWKQSGLIPAKHQQEVLSAAKRVDVKLGPADFFPAEG